jgi:predicted DNA-binding protein
MPAVRKFPPRWKQVSFRLPGDVWLRLKATAAALGQSQAQIVKAALALYFEQLTPRERHAVDEVLAVRQKP